MTTLRDLLNDFGLDCLNEGLKEGDIQGTDESHFVDDRVDELIQEIKERLIG